MNHLLQYLLQSSVCLAALYLVYWVFLRRETFFTLNRFYLVTAAILSLLMPLFKINLYELVPTRSVVVYLDPVFITPEKIEHVTSQYGDGLQTLWIIYLTGAAIFLLRLVFQLVQLGILTRKHEVRKNEDVTIVMVENGHSPFSFFNYIFLDLRDPDEKGISAIINHERIHAKQLHSADLIIMELLIIVQWFNPFAWFIGRSIKTVHEFLADEGVLQNGLSKHDYQKILLNRAAGIQISTLANNFNFSLLKTRIIMMTKTKSPAWAKSKLILALPIFMMVLFLFSTTSFEKIVAQTTQTKSVQKTGEPQKNKTEKKEAQKQQIHFAPVPDNIKKADQANAKSESDQVFTVVENLPSFPGGQSEMTNFLMQNIKYPTVAKEKGIQGTVFVTFVVKADGSVTNVKVLRGIGNGCDEEAVRVVGMMPKWNPGTQKGKPVNVQFNLPIKFMLEKKNEDKQVKMDQKKKQEQIMMEKESEQKKKEDEQLKKERK